MSSVLYLDWGGDFVLTPNGSVQMANGWDEARQLTVRALLTNPATQLPTGEQVPPDYVFDPEYGAGLGLYVGVDMNTTQVNKLQGLINSQVLNQSFVDPTYEPQVTFTSVPVHGMIVTINMRLVNKHIGTVALQVN